jgi:hypothetical protein
MTTKNILCIKWGSKYGGAYVNRLYEGVREHLSGTLRFICLTDDPSGLRDEVEALPLPVTPFDEAEFDRRPGGSTWRKVGLFQPELADLQGDTLFLDLDIVITGSMDDFFTFAPGKFCVIQDWLEKRRAKYLPGRDGRVGNTSIFRFNPEKHRYVYSHFAENEAWALENFRIEQQYVSHTLRNDLEFWPEKWVRSFKRSCRPTFPFNLICEPQEPADMRILVFHGYPLPDQAINGYKGGLLKSTLPAPWIKNYWRAIEEAA